MVSGLTLRVSWICLMLIRIGDGFPPIPDFRFSYPATGPSTLDSEAVSPQASSPLGNQSPSSPVGPSVATGSPSSDKFVVTYDTGPDSSPSVPELRSFRPWYVGTTKKTGSPVQRQQGSGTGGSRGGLAGAAPGLVYPSNTAGNTRTGFYYSGGSHLQGGPGSGFGASSGTGGSGGGPGPHRHPFLPWGQVLAGDLLFNPNNLDSLVPAGRLFPDGDAWYSEEVPRGSIELPPLPPSSYIIQSRSGYQRAREVLSHSKYSEDHLDHLPFPSFESPSGTGSQGTKKV